MRISSSHFLICAALASSIGWAVSVPDTEVQAKAREAVRQKIRELQGQVGASVVAPVPSAPADEAGIARAREAVRERLGQSSEPPDTAIGKSEAARAREEKATAKAEAARAKEESARAKGEAASVKGRPVISAEAGSETSRAGGVGQSGTSGSAASLAAQPYPPSGNKEARLAELLKLYRADTITPAEYHTQRAAIVAGS